MSSSDRALRVVADRVGRPDKPIRPSSLAQAVQWADRCWPGRGAPLAAWLVFHQRRAALYEQAAHADPGHRHEARYLASVEREEAERISRALASGDAQSATPCAPGGVVEDEEQRRR